MLCSPYWLDMSSDPVSETLRIHFMKYEIGYIGWKDKFMKHRY